MSAEGILTTDKVIESRAAIKKAQDEAETGEISYEKADELRFDLFEEVIGAIARDNIDHDSGESAGSLCAAALGWMEGED